MTERYEIDALRRSYAQGEQFVAVHYACESFADVQDRPLAVACVAVIDLRTNSEQIFALSDAPPSIEGEGREIAMLDQFYAWLRNNQDARILHWNMHGGLFGFAPLATRYHHLTGVDAPFQVSAQRTYDVDELIEVLYGSSYVRHPKLASVATLNGISRRQVLTGLEEAQRFSRGEIGTVAASTSAKARTIARLFSLLMDGALRTQNSVGTLSFANGRLEAVETVLTLGQRVRLVANQLSKRHGSRPTLTLEDEYDAQDLMAGLLRVFFDDVRAESVTPEYAGGSARLDFKLPDFALGVELKFMRASLGDRKLADELLVDRERYAEDSAIKHLVCLVFDHDLMLNNARGLESDLSRDISFEKFPVTVRIFDH